jgi:hypothetical protein
MMVMGWPPVRPALRHGVGNRQLLYLHGVGNRSPTHIDGGARTLGLCRVSWVHAPVGVGLVVRRVDLSCEAGNCRARWRLVVRGGDLS